MGTPGTGMYSNRRHAMFRRVSRKRTPRFILPLADFQAASSLAVFRL